MEQHGKTLCQEESGFSLVELIIYMALLGILMTMVFSTFTPVMRTSSRQWRMAETKIETGLGLDFLRSDLEHAGFGLPWEFPVGVVLSNYSENVDPPAPATGAMIAALAAMRDTPNVPRALISEDGSILSLNGSDYLAIKALNVAPDVASQKWGLLGRNALHAASVQSLSTETFVATDNVIVIRPDLGTGESRQLVLNGTNYFAPPTPAGLTPFAPPETPNDPSGERYLVYGLVNTINPIMPFNRTDYFINAVGVSAHCAPGTGTLVKATLNQADGIFSTFPIVDCVADFQVVYYLDTDGDGGWDTRANASGLTGLTAQQIRSQVKAIRCYVLTHEGGVDQTYTLTNPNKNVGEIDPLVVNALPTQDPDSTAPGVLLAGRAFNVSTMLPGIGATWVNYRWKVNSLAVTPRNLQ